MESGASKLKNLWLIKTGTERCYSLQREGKSGFALVLVLTIIMLLTALIIAFFASVTTELNSTQTAVFGDASRRMAESTVQMVAAQLMDATKSLDTAGNPLAWASQPGMIRTYSEDGTPFTYYKLYSAVNDTVPAATFSVADELPLSDWDTEARKGLYTDLNSPVIRDNRTHFQIVDPRAKSTSATGSVAGFDYFPEVNGVVLPNADADSQRLPMPALWLYQLRDGTLLAPDLTASNNGTVAFSGSVLPTKENPIVGRIAYWTDDETCKVNINTASEGVYYDIPRFYSQDEYKLADRPPVIGEFQRYPGHPSTTSLSAVLGAWLPITSGAVETNSFADIRKYYALAPRINPDGGSEGGTIDTNNAATSEMPIENNRLYASPDEMLYSPDRTANAPEITRSVLDRTRFFLTAQSRSPDVNLFGRPRITIWPLHVQNDSLYRTTQDQLIAFAATVNGFPYYFQRSNPKSASEDYASIQRNRELYSYLQNETSSIIPGFGGNFVTKWGADRDQILTSIFDYIRSSNLNDPNTVRPTQAEGGTYTEQMTRDTGSGVQYQWWTANPDQLIRRSPGQVVPIQIGSTKGAGRFGVIDQAAIVFHASQAPVRLSTPNTIRAYVSAYYLFSWYHPMLGAMNCVDLFKVSAEQSGAIRITPSSSGAGVTVSLAPGDDGNLQMLKNKKQTLDAGYWARNGTGGNGRSWGGLHGHSVFTDARKAFFTSGKPAENFPFASDHTVAIDITDTSLPSPNPDPDIEKRVLDDVLSKVQFAFTTAKLDLSILAQNDTEIQNYIFNFPAAGPLPLPKARRTGVAPSETLYYTTYDQRFHSGFKWLAPLTGGDVVRSLLPSETIGCKGDLRILAYTANVPETWFTPHKGYSDNTIAMAHTFRTGVGNELWGAFASGKPGLLVKDLSPSFDISRPYIRTEINGVSRSDGGFADWDNGHGDRPDGAYLNKADEGIGPGSGGKPYFDWDGLQQQKNLTSPNRQIPSGLMFGSIPTGVKRGRAWETLLFRPDSTHPGANAPADYLLLDFFHMPIVEPYAISEPLSTAGRVNMNYQILPFSYITRNTGVHAVLKSERVIAIPDSYTNYKSNYSSPSATRYRHAINMEETLKAFESRFANNDVFRSASEICAIPFVPEIPGVTNSNITTFWSSYRRTGDNTKERPYVTTYPRLTTKSNTFTVHLRVQALKKISSTSANVFVEGRDRVVSEYRGSATIERYVDAADPSLPDFATDPAATLDTHYKFRILNTKRFAP